MGKKNEEQTYQLDCKRVSVIVNLNSFLDFHIYWYLNSMQSGPPLANVGHGANIKRGPFLIHYQI